MFTELPPLAAWRHKDARDGFETVFFRRSGGYELEGYTAAVELDEAWFVQYAIRVDTRWRTTSSARPRTVATRRARSSYRG